MWIVPANFILCNMKGHVDSSDHIFLETAYACYVTLQYDHEKYQTIIADFFGH